MNRWQVVATYRTNNGPVDVEHQIEELEELQNLIERGPDWNTLVNIMITYHRPIYPDLTVEQARDL